jgi:hypothetical protein
MHTILDILFLIKYPSRRYNWNIVESGVKHHKQNLKYPLPGNISLRFAGGLFVSRVNLYSAVLTGNTGFTINFKGNFTMAVATLGAPERQNVKL